jgi:beta-glucosidase
VNKNATDPRIELKSFQRITLYPNEIKKVIFILENAHFSYNSDNGDKTIESGKYKIYVSSALPVKRSLDLKAPKWVEKEINIK